jgi:hypothetical protein
MDPLPARDLRSNLGTWAVVTADLPAVAYAMIGKLPAEDFDPNFQGQHLHTTYFDTADFDLRKARVNKDAYITIRVRSYMPSGVYALSAKTESAKFRVELPPDVPDAFDIDVLSGLLPPDMLARLLAITSKPLVPVVCVHFRRYAVEDNNDRLTLDVGIDTDTGKCYPCHVLEYKSTQLGNDPPGFTGRLRPIKLSKFLWSTSPCEASIPPL